jgi:hypothetical protein
MPPRRKTATAAAAAQKKQQTLANLVDSDGSEVESVDEGTLPRNMFPLSCGI